MNNSIIPPATDTGKAGHCAVFGWCGEPEHESTLFGWYPANPDGAPFRDHTADLTRSGILVVREAAIPDGSVVFSSPVFRLFEEGVDLDPLAPSSNIPDKARALAASIVLPASWRLVVSA